MPECPCKKVLPVGIPAVVGTLLLLLPDIMGKPKDFLIQAAGTALLIAAGTVLMSRQFDKQKHRVGIAGLGAVLFLTILVFAIEPNTPKSDETIRNFIAPYAGALVVVVAVFIDDEIRNSK